MIVLQSAYQFFGGPGSTPSSIIISFAAVLVGVALLILIAALINRRNRLRTPAEEEAFSSASFRRTAKGFGLPPAHLAMLENLVRVTKVRQPTMVFRSAGLLDDVLKKGLYSLQSARGVTPEEREKRAAIIFQIKQIIERNAGRGPALRSTTLLKPGQVLTVTPQGGTSFASRLVSNMKDFLMVAAPQPTAGADSRWMRGTRLSVYLWRDGDAGYSFQSKVLGYDRVKGISCVLIQHSRTLRREQRRRNRRREIMKACFYYPIRIDEVLEGRTVQRKASVERSRRAVGTVIDLSAGGCAIQTLTPLEKGGLVLVEFDIDRQVPIRAYGKVVSVRRQGSRGGSMHVMFTRVTRQHLNRISEFVYNFGRPATTAEARRQLQQGFPGALSGNPSARFPAR
ncbi:MAG TPA: PilZ domain-containing protein [Spirochaetia bacterium]|nr:PilZ domain-containing protein [Spirochaetia bacterium]